MASLFTKDTLPSTSEEAIRRFDERYNAIVSSAPPSGWAERFTTTVDAPRTTFPLSAFTSGFRETKEESGRYRGMAEKTFDLSVVEFDDGYEAKLSDLLTNVFAWQRWTEIAGELVTSEARHHATQLVTLLEAGTSTTCKYDGVNFFATTHLCDPTNPDSTTFSNYQSAGADPVTLSNIQTEMINMQKSVLDVNGKKLGVMPDEIWLPTEKFQAVSDKLNQAFLATGESNYMAGKLKVVHVPELTDVNDWYLVDSKLLSKFVPMVAAKWTELDGRLGMRYLDESSDHFIKTGKIAVSKHIWAGYGLLFPHAIRKVVGA
jgi:hypothetical protein